MSQDIHVGVCGFCLPQAKLFERFRLLEVQQTFYWPPQLKTVERWRRDAPADFEYTIKAFQVITHPCSSPTYRRTKFTAAEQAECGNFGDTPTVRAAWETTRQIAVALEAPFVVFQCPPKFDASDEHVTRIKAFFHWIDRGAARLAWEPRHATWTDGLIGELCRELDLIHAVDPLERLTVHGSPAYLRLHGEARGCYRYNYNHPYSDGELATIRKHLPAGLSYLLFNNIQMAADAERFEGLLVKADRVLPE
jgi:uncharacterized protein YecE (DUF72 family)